jgi:D-serine deaminase-like pyridoxal phosphate-dependent protein
LEFFVHYRELSTPALTLNLDVLGCNLDAMARRCRSQNLGLRPHTKTHKLPEVARMQVERGAVGITVAKVGEAEVMAEAGLDDILTAFPIYGRQNLDRLAKLARERRILMSLDSEETAQALSAACKWQDASVGVLVELDVGYHRCGLEPGDACAQLARKIEKLPGLKFRGLMTYFGNIWGVEGERRKQARTVAENLERTMAAFAREHMPVEIVSGGSTPSAPLASEIPGLTEIRPGTYAYNDLNTLYQGVCRLEDCAVRVVTTVVSTAVASRAIIDAGSKTLSSDRLASGTEKGNGCVTEVLDAPLFALDEEHGYIDTSRSTHQFRVGEVLTVIPNHVCPCVNLHDEVFLLRGEQVVGEWKVSARGKVR